MGEVSIVVEKIDSSRHGNIVDFFVTCSSFEDRCLGVPCKLSEKTEFRTNYVFVYTTPSPQRDRNLRTLEEMLARRGDIQLIHTLESDPFDAIGLLYRELKKYKEDLGQPKMCVTLDISTFTKRHLLLLLKCIDDLELWDCMRILYTEPKKYVTDLYLPMSIGIRTISPIGGFITNSPPNLPVLLIIFLGYEGDRARAIYENLEPDETVLIVPRPAYHDEWEGTTEKMNHSLIQMVGKDKVEYADSISPSIVSQQLENIAGKYDSRCWKFMVSPLGTKPQAVGLYFFWRTKPDSFSIIYAEPLKHNQPFYSTGIGRTWLLKPRTTE